ncbi:hypothetical protein HOA92_02425 [archaeon]|jgi:plastocyanin|nr:hypothetical protein [archaeon]MBT6761871.1 hypothetical protein [archaeon]
MKKLIMMVLLVFSVFLIISCAPVEEVAEEVAEEVEEVAEVEVVEEPLGEPEMDSEEMADELVYATSGDIDIYGFDGFSVDAYTLSVGESVVFVNMNTEDDPISIVTLTFQDQENKRYFETSTQFDIGESYTHTFERAGNYLGWTVGYGVMLPITVTE